MERFLFCLCFFIFDYLGLGSFVLLLLLLVREETMVLMGEVESSTSCAPEDAVVETRKALEGSNGHQYAWHEHTLRTSHGSLARLKNRLTEKHFDFFIF